MAVALYVHGGPLFRIFVVMVNLLIYIYIYIYIYILIAKLKENSIKF